MALHVSAIWPQDAINSPRDARLSIIKKVATPPVYSDMRIKAKKSWIVTVNTKQVRSAMQETNLSSLAVSSIIQQFLA